MTFSFRKVTLAPSSILFRRIGLCAEVFAALAIAAVQWVDAQENSTITIQLSDGKPPVSNEVLRCRPGPWGSLEYYYVNLEAPDEFIREATIPSEITVWRFVGMDVDQVNQFLIGTSLPEQIWNELHDKSAWYTSAEETRIFPNDYVIANLPPESRRQIYSVVRPWLEGQVFFQPITVEIDSLEECFSGYDLPTEVVSLVKGTAYRLGNRMVFSDIPFVLSHLDSEEQSRRFLKALTRTRSIVLLIKADRTMDLPALASYWAAGTRYKDSLPLLESVSRTEGTDNIDITHLLPPLPRKHIYTFPNPGAGSTGRYPEGFWTAFNFFEFWPKETFSDDPQWIDTQLRERYSPIEQAIRFGDLIVLRDPKSGLPIHACVFIADDIVYTKNGPSVFRPWTMMKLKSVLNRWSADGTPEVEYWRVNS